MRIQIANIPQETRPPLGIKVNKPRANGYGTTEKAVLSTLPVVGSFLPLFEGSKQDTWRALGLSATAALMNAASSMGLVYGIVTGNPVVTGASIAALGATGYIGSLS